MKEQIEKLKAELREFLELSKGITQGKWNHVVHTHSVYSEHDAPICDTGGDTMIPDMEQRGRNAAFIARSRNISPAMAECLLVAVEGLENKLQTTELYEGHGGDAKTQALLQQILTIWEASK